MILLFMHFGNVFLWYLFPISTHKIELRALRSFWEYTLQWSIVRGENNKTIINNLEKFDEYQNKSLWIVVFKILTCKYSDPWILTFKIKLPWI